MGISLKQQTNDYDVKIQKLKNEGIGISQFEFLTPANTSKILLEKYIKEREKYIKLWEKNSDSLSELIIFKFEEEIKYLKEMLSDKENYINAKIVN